jgi:nicotinate-nucleotide pyrophosphorylase (carboxylating)
MTDVHPGGIITRIIEEAMMEDIGMGDITTDAIVPPGLQGVGEIGAKGSGVVAGLEIAAETFRISDPELVFSPLVEDGSSVDAGTLIATIEGSLAGILKGERTALNFLQRMSGIATLTRRFVDAVSGTRARITDTRKTAPGLRVLDKLAVRLGGGMNHRFGLDDMMLIKDNHIAAAGGITKAVEEAVRSQRASKHHAKVEVETKTLDEVREALACPGINRIMLDNFSLTEMKRAVALVNRAVEVEASGNVTLESVRAIAETGVGYISVGALTHSAPALDLSLNIRPPGDSSRPSGR